MGWKLRKDKMKAEEPQAEAAPSEETSRAEAVAPPPLEPHDFADVPPEPHELSTIPAADDPNLTPLPKWDGTTFNESTGTADAEQPAIAHYEAAPVTEAVSVEPEMPALSFASHSTETPVFEDVDDLTFDEDAETPPLAAAGPTYADAPALGSVYALEPAVASDPLYDDAPEPTMAVPVVEALAPSATESVDFAPGPLLPTQPAFDAETVAPALVSTDTASGLPRVAPFIIDAPAAADGSTAGEEMRHLILRLGNLSATFPLVKEVTVIGRPDSKLHYYPDIEIELDDAVSRRHAEIIRRDAQYFVVDAGSTNGTMLNGENLPPHEEQALMHGDRIRLGERAEIIFE